MSISRRRFLETAAISPLAVNAAMGMAVDGKTGMPTRVLGRTKARVSIMAFGCGSRFLMYKEEDKALEALNKALDLGITYIDTAFGYGRGVSEERVGKVLKSRGSQGLWLATKVQDRGADQAMRVIEGSLKRLQRDNVDLLHIHGLADEKDLAAIEAPDGVLKLMYKLRDQKVARFIGITCHAYPTALKMALERHDFDCTQMALNAARMGMVDTNRGMRPSDPMQQQSFESLALPVALKKKMGVTAMKIFAQEKLSGAAPVEKLIRYSMSLPVAAAVIGMPKLEHIDENIGIAKSFKPFSKTEMKSISDEVARQHKASIDRFFCDHVDA